MKLSIFASYVMKRTFDEPETGLKFMYDQGVRYVDISEGLLHMFPMHTLMQYFQEAQLTPECMITVQDIATAEGVQKEENREIVKGYIDQLAQWKVPYLMVAPRVIHAHSRQELDRMQEQLIEGLTELADYAVGTGVMVTIENQSALTRADSSMKDIRTILDAVPGLGYVLDTGNFHCIREDVLEAYELLRDRLVHAHVKDWSEDMSGVVPGEGVLPLKELLMRMNRYGYQGSAALEFNDCIITADALARAAAFVRSKSLL